MTFFFTLVAIFQSFAISLGVGSSTLAIINFFVAISDGTIDPTERRMMGIVYVVLRIAMVVILVTTVLLISHDYPSITTGKITPFLAAQLFALLVLFGNAILMTVRLMPSTFGPAIQAGSWYTLGTLSALMLIGQANFTFSQFLLVYSTWIVLAIGIVNGVMALINDRAKNKV